MDSRTVILDAGLTGLARYREVVESNSVPMALHRWPFTDCQIETGINMLLRWPSFRTA